MSIGGNIGLLCHIAKINVNLFEYLLNKGNIKYKKIIINTEIMYKYELGVRLFIEYILVEILHDEIEIADIILNYLLWDYDEMIMIPFRKKKKRKMKKFNIEQLERYFNHFNYFRLYILNGHLNSKDYH